jgi:hypothetical protein
VEYDRQMFIIFNLELNYSCCYFKAKSLDKQYVENLSVKLSMQKDNGEWQSISGMYC